MCHWLTAFWYERQKWLIHKIQTPAKKKKKKKKPRRGTSVADHITTFFFYYVSNLITKFPSVTLWQWME
jgi:hypothetical protein